jgi:hypothetical protein
MPFLSSSEHELLPQGTFVKYIQQETGTRVQIKGIGSGFVNQETGLEDPEPMHIHITYAYIRHCPGGRSQLFQWAGRKPNSTC